MPRGKRTIVIANSDKERKNWTKHRNNIVKSIFNQDGQLKRPQIDTWAAIDEWGFTPEEFRLLYCIARFEQWKGKPGGTKIRINGCYASADKMNRLTGISRNKIFEILKLFQGAKIITKLNARGRTPEKRGKDSGVTLAGWTFEYGINPVTEWLAPWDLAEMRDNLKLQKENRKNYKKEQS